MTYKCSDIKTGRSASMQAPTRFHHIFMFTGRRMCLGDVLARMELLLLLSSILHVFHLELPKDQPLPSLRGNTGVTVTPETYKVPL
jgi:cytochrome P450